MEGFLVSGKQEQGTGTLQSKSVARLHFVAQKINKWLLEQSGQTDQTNDELMLGDQKDLGASKCKGL